MRVAVTSVAAGRAGRANEDFAGVVPDGAVLVDGAGIPGGELVCRHGAAWYASRLGGTLLGLLPGSGRHSLPALLAEAIERVTDDHRDTCDIKAPTSPCAAVAVLRVSGGLVEHLVLGDCVIMLDRVRGEPVVVTDRREVVISRTYESLLEGVPEGSEEYRRLIRELRAHRNRAGGFWVAKDEPRAAAEAVTGSGPASEFAGAVLLSNGASRVVDRFGLVDWPGVPAMLTAEGPEGIIGRVRQAEQRRAVAPDDATIIHCTAFAGS